MKIILTRHGQSQTNIEKRVAGQFDTPLTEKWITEAKNVATYLADISVDAIFTSSLQRAFLTAQTIGEHHPWVNIVSSDVLMEWHVWIFTGMHAEEIRKQLGLEWKSLSANMYDSPEVESKEAMLARVEQFVQQFILWASYDTIVIVSHNRFQNMLCQYFLWEIHVPGRFDNCSITEILREPDWPTKLLRYNDTNYLQLT